MLERVKIDGCPPFKEITISMAHDEAVRSASGNFLIVGDGLPVLPGDDVRITATGDLILTGYARNVDPSHDLETRELSVGIFSRTIDCVECSVVHPTGEVRNKNLADIAREFDTLGIGVEDDGGLPVEPLHRLRLGESQFETIARRAKGRGALIHDTPEGKLKIATKPAGTHSGGLIYGRNIKTGSASFTERNAFSKVHVRGQATEGTDAQQLRGQAVAQNSAVRRNRPLIIAHEGESTVDRMKTRAEWRAKRAAGFSATATIPVVGWRDDRGRIWTPNYLVYVDDPKLSIKGLMLIKSVTLTQTAEGENGTTATLSLVDPRSAGGENPRGSTSGAYAAPGNISAEWEQE